MKTLVRLGRLHKIHQSIKSGNTGTPKEFASFLGISQSLLYNILDDLKTKRFPIEYSRNLKSYIYTCYCDLKIEYSVKLITEEKEIKIEGNKK